MLKVRDMFTKDSQKRPRPYFSLSNPPVSGYNFNVLIMKEDKRKRLRLQKRKKERRKKAERLKLINTSLDKRNRNVYQNRRFNREELSHENIYYDNYGWAPRQNHSHDGWIKCRLLHGLGYSLVVPDQLFISNSGLKWIQPLAFSSVYLIKKDDNNISSKIDIDISCGNNIKVSFFNSEYVQSYADGSQLFHCKIIGPKNLYEYATGDAEWGAGNIPYLRLFHHTTEDSYAKIIASGYFLSSPYNIQGTSKRLKNVTYAYFTPLDRITTSGDLRKIAMAPEGIIHLRRDSFTPPRILNPGWEEFYKDDILQLPVYACDPSKRQATLGLWIDSTVLAPQHIYRHDDGGPVYFEIPHSFIQRIGTEPNNKIAFDNRNRVHRQDGLKSFEYVVVGDCKTLAGLEAPYDEEDTTNIMKIERVLNGQNLLDFWFDFRNQDLYSEKQVEVQEFRK